jgi:hypothetical protein
MEATEKSLELMRTQTQLMDQITEVQDSIKNAVTNRQWDDFDTLVETMRDYSARLSELDTERTALFAKLTATTFAPDTLSLTPIAGPLVSDTQSPPAAAGVRHPIAEPLVSDTTSPDAVVAGVRHRLAEPLVSDTAAGPAAPDTPQPQEARLYAFASRLPEAERRQFTELYRGLRLRAMRLRAASDALLLYLSEAKNTVDGFIDAAFPERKSKLYSRRGTQIAADMRSMVLNRVF